MDKCSEFKRDLPDSLSTAARNAVLAPRSDPSCALCIWFASLDSPIVGMLAIVRLLCFDPALPTPELQLSPLSLSLSLAVEERSFMLAALFIDRGATAPSGAADAGAAKKSLPEDPVPPAAAPGPKDCCGCGGAVKPLVELPAAKKRNADIYLLSSSNK